MGSPYDVIVVTPRGPEMFRGQTSGDDFPERFFFGRAAARRWCEQNLLRANMPDELSGACDAGAVIDEVRRVLMFWCDLGVAWWDVPMRRVLLALMEVVWEGWSVQWGRASKLRAYLRDAANIDEDVTERAFVDLHDWYSPVYEAVRAPERDRTRVSSILSVRARDGSLRLIPTDKQQPPMLARPPSMREYVRSLLLQGRGLPSSTDLGFLSEFALDTMPSSGTHVDLSTRRIEFWSAEIHTCRGRIMEYAPGFDVVDHGDRFEAQLDACGGRLRFPERDVVTLSREWRDIILGDKSVGAEEKETFAAAESAIVARARTLRPTPYR